MIYVISDLHGYPHERFLGLLTLFIGGNIIYSIIVHSWTDTFLCSLIFAGIMAILMAVVVVQDFCDSVIQKIGML